MNQNFSKLLYLNNKQVKKICKELDAVKIIGEVFQLHGKKQTVLPDEAYLSWNVAKDESARSLNMPAYIGGKFNAAGTKIINANIANTKRGIPRASALTLLFDPKTGMIISAMEGAYISSLRTASVSILGVELLKQEAPMKVAIIGLGVQGQMHLELLLTKFSDIQKIYLFDNDLVRLKTILQKYKKIRDKIFIAKNSKEAVVNSNVVITTTTVDKGYIQADWLQKGTLIVHVSLDDLLPEAISKADKLIVDDWNLVKNGTNRIMGKMIQKGQIFDFNERKKNLPYIYAEFAEVVINKKGRHNQDEIIIFNPFGLAIEDIGIAHYVYKKALEKNIGRMLIR